MKKLLYVIALISTALSAAQEHTRGMLNFGVTRTALERINSEMNDFTRSSEADQFKPKYDKIRQQLMNPVGDDEQAQIKKLLNIVADARNFSSDSATGEPLMWSCMRDVCSGHTYSRKYDSHRSALDNGKNFHQEYKQKEAILANSVQLYEVKQHGSKTGVAVGAAGTAYGSGFVAVGAAGTVAAVRRQLFCPVRDNYLVRFC